MSGRRHTVPADDTFVLQEARDSLPAWPLEPSEELVMPFEHPPVERRTNPRPRTLTGYVQQSFDLIPVSLLLVHHLTPLALTRTSKRRDVDSYFDT